MRGHDAACRSAAGEDIGQMSGGAHVKRVRALHQRKFRGSEGLFLAQGRKVVAELLRSDLEVVELFGTREIADLLGAASMQVLPAKDLERMGTFKQGNEVVAVVRKPAAPTLRMPGAGRFVLALDQISDPGNLGTLLRIADWFGAQQVWCAGETVEVWNPKCVQASMGSVFRMAVLQVDLPAVLREAAAVGVQVFKAEASGTNVFQTQLQRPAILVMGSESHGLSREVRSAPGRSIAIPSFGGAESLNVSAAAAALCMELARGAAEG